MGPKRLHMTLLGNIMCQTVAINLTKKLLGAEKIAQVKDFCQEDLLHKLMLSCNGGSTEPVSPGLMLCPIKPDLFKSLQAFLKAGIGLVTKIKRNIARVTRLNAQFECSTGSKLNFAKPKGLQAKNYPART